MKFVPKFLTRLLQPTQYVVGNLRVLTISDLLGNFSRRLVFPYASLYVLALGGSATQIGLIAFLGQVAGLFLLPVAGHITDRADRIRLLVLTGFLFTAFLSLNVIAPSWQVVALANLLMGLVVFQFPAYASLVADALIRGGRGQGIGCANMISNSVAIIAPFLAGLVIVRFGDNLGMRMLYGAMVILSLAGTVIQMRFLREQSVVPREPLHWKIVLDGLQRAYRDIPVLVRRMSTAVRALTLVIMLSFVVQSLIGPFWVVYAVGPAGLSAAQWGLILLVESITGVALFVPAGVLVDRWGRTATLVTALVLSMMATPMFVVLHGFAAILLVRMTLAVAFVLGAASCMALMADLVPRASRGQVMAAIGQGGIQLGSVGNPGGPSVGYLIIPPVMVGGLAGGFLYAYNPLVLWIVATVVGLLAVVLTVVFVRDPRDAEE